MGPNCLALMQLRGQLPHRRRCKPFSSIHQVALGPSYFGLASVAPQNIALFQQCLRSISNTRHKQNSICTSVSQMGKWRARKSVMKHCTLGPLPFNTASNVGAKSHMITSSRLNKPTDGHTWTLSMYSTPTNALCKTRLLDPISSFVESGPWTISARNSLGAWVA